MDLRPGRVRRAGQRSATPTDQRLAAVRAGALDPGRHILRAGVKGITYHGLEIRQVKDRLRARLVFDV